MVIVQQMAIPLMMGEDGVIRVSATRVTLETVVAAFDGGQSPEGIVDQYPSLALADAYLLISYLLQHRTEIEPYLRERQERADAIRQETESRFDAVGIRERLIRRRSAE